MCGGYAFREPGQLTHICGRENFSSRSRTLAHSKTHFRRNQRLYLVEKQVVQFRARLPPDLDRVFEASGGDESDPCSLALQQRVGAHGGAVQ